MTDLSARAQVMAVPDSISVSETGGAIQSFPIAVPPGTAGVVPSLSITYNSQGSNGIVGMGFMLNGLASIGRCPRTFATDGVRGGGVNFDANDRFCLDGQRLIAISGTYGANGTEYHTELESFSKVISFGTAGTGPAWFRVWTKSGQVMEFGNSTDSRILATGRAEARSWAVNRVADTAGNYMTVTYVNDTANGQAFPSRIDYTGNSGASLTPYNSVRFVYNTTRTDVLTAYLAGSFMRTTALLTNVQTYAGNGLVSDDRFAYNSVPATNRMRLRSVTLCEGGGACLPATNIGWSSGGDLSGGFVKSTIPATESIPNNYNIFAEGDFNGDGLPDLYLADSKTDGRAFGGESTQSDQVWLSRGNGTFEKLIFQGGDKIAVNNRVFTSGDFNGDGLTDLYLADSRPDGRAFGTTEQQPDKVWLSNGNGTFTKLNFQGTDKIALNNRVFATGDFNGDGLSDFYLQLSQADGRAAGGQSPQIWRSPGPIPDILSTVTSGLGEVTSITYRPMTDGTIYTKDAGTNAASYPIVDVISSMLIATRIEQTDGVGGLRSSTYRYTGAKADATGRGFLGFREMTARDEQTGIEQRSAFEQLYPFTLMKKSETRSVNGRVLSTMVNSYSSADLGGTRRRVFLTQSTASGTDLNGAPLPSSTTTYQYDAYSNATQITVSASDGFSKTTTNTYLNDTSNWLLGRLLTANVTSQAPNVESQVPAADTTPDPFDFTDVTNASPSTVYETGVNLPGFNRAVTASVSGAGAQIRKNGIGNWVTSLTIAPGDRLNLRMTSSSAHGAAVTATVTVGGVSGNWIVSTSRVIIISSNVNSFNLRAAHDALYPAPTGTEIPRISVIAIVQPGVIVGSANSATPAFDVGNWPAGIPITMHIRGRIQGAGGDGGNITSAGGAASAGGPGGLALFARFPITMILNDGVTGEIWGGGGGGGGPNSVSGGGNAGGGGGGAGQLPGKGGTGSGGGNFGAPGTTEAGGNGNVTGRAGGNGGGPGLPGSSAAGPSPGPGGAAGTAIDGLSFITKSGTGDIRGAQVN